MLPLSVLEGNDESWRREGDSLGCTLVTLHAKLQRSAGGWMCSMALPGAGPLGNGPRQ